MKINLIDDKLIINNILIINERLRFINKYIVIL